MTVEPNSLEDKRARVTLILTKALDQNMELFCMVRGEKKTDVVQKALKEYLRNNGVANPEADPELTIEKHFKRA